MRPFYLILLLALTLPAMSQEEGVPDEQPGSTADSEAEVDEAEAGEAEEEIDDSDLDIQTYEEPDDVFIPTEEIPSDEPIPFPSNI